MEKNKSNILIIAVVVALLAAAGVAYILRDNAKARKAVETRTEEALRAGITQRDEEIGRLQTLNARRLARKAQAESGGLDQVTLEDVLRSEE